MRNTLRVALASTLATVSLVGCRDSVEPTRTAAPFSVHEWGLFAVDAIAPNRAIAATEATGGFHASAGMNLGSFGTLGVKPVFYVHLAEGVSATRLSLRLSVPTESLLERWPAGAQLAATERRTTAGWQDVHVRRGQCEHPAPAPTADSATCRNVRDGFCEASEIPRYYGGKDSCLTVGSEETELLFYRAGDLPTQRLPLRMAQSGDAWTIERVGTAPIEGPVFWLTSEGAGENVHIRRLGVSDFGHPLDPSATDATSPETVRTALTTEAVRRGLTANEANAFVDAWSPAFFDHCTRTGPEASGTTPTALRQSKRSLLYFAPASVVDAMLPLTTDPPARATHRVFLVRWVDGSALLP